eukprot:TRINITY_DN13953_c0_g1_i1.p1 TRINITY_DN13953_c0_g1~~TRINITY_DN13953_c0_g1_i1.p1  ORF type:complete len:410 (-),score=51.51 TRINITY_DN13953_c0_g1_i1:5-1234(-)
MEPNGDHSGNREHDAQRDLRRRIMEIQKDASLSPTDKSKKIQELMTANWAESQRKKEVEEESDTSGLTIAEEAVSFHDEKRHILGCKHYQRKAKLKAACCGRLFVCRLCHDEQVKDHKIDRYATEYMFCMLCKKVGEFGQKCTHCNEILGKYHCGVCKFLDDTPNKDIYHCLPCGLCRIGVPGRDTAHCDSCGVCMTLERYNNHKHIERQLHSDCPICGGYMFDSTQPVSYLPCGHAMHAVCFRQHLRSHTTCPICNKSAVNLASYWAQLDALISRVQMPPEYRKVEVDILCNDCGDKTSDLKFHFYGVKCPKCKSYNTRFLATRGYDPNAVADPAETPQTGEEGQVVAQTTEELEEIMDAALRDFEGEEDDEDESGEFDSLMSLDGDEDDEEDAENDMDSEPVSDAPQ